MIRRIELLKTGDSFGLGSIVSVKFIFKKKDFTRRVDGPIKEHFYWVCLTTGESFSPNYGLGKVIDDFYYASINTMRVK